ncbi:MAG TPA: circadian clock protein KaiC, partial [Burkholderiales bacterium]|nr:circadian clock protein KaiC [Burkholderiales bacterium]
TLVCGGAGSGKTNFGLEFLIRGATEFDEPGVLIAFEETPGELAGNVASLGFDLNRLIRDGKLAVDYIQIERSEIEEAGEFDLEGLFLRLGLAVDSVGAKRVVIDTPEALFSSLPNEFILRAEMRRLFRWLKDRGLTAVITGERGNGTLTRYGLEEYVSDCVIVLDNRLVDQMSIRRLRVAKYRGSAHGMNEYPFLIGEGGFSVIPLSALKLDHKVSGARQSSGIPDLDAMLEGKGYYRGSTVLVSGTAGTGKSSLAAHFANAVCSQGKRCLYFAFEEGQEQIVRNMSTIGLNLRQWVEPKRLVFHAARPTEHGLEMHLALIHKMLVELRPEAVVIDPITNFGMVGNSAEVKSMLMRLLDFLKGSGITCLFTSLTSGGSALESTDVGVSSLVDTWLSVRDIESNGERNRGLYVLKSRGMAHSNQIREFLITSKGIKLVDVYLGREGALTGTARLAQEARDREEAAARQLEEGQLQLQLERRRVAVEAQIRSLRQELAAEESELRRVLDQTKSRKESRDAERKAMTASRRVDARSASPANRS